MPETTTAIPTRYSRLPAIKAAYSAGVADFGKGEYNAYSVERPDSALRAAYRAGWTCARQAAEAANRLAEVGS